MQPHHSSPSDRPSTKPFPLTTSHLKPLLCLPGLSFHPLTVCLTQSSEDKEDCVECGDSRSSMVLQDNHRNDTVPHTYTCCMCVHTAAYTYTPSPYFYTLHSDFPWFCSQQGSSRDHQPKNEDLTYSSLEATCTDITQF